MEPPEPTQILKPIFHFTTRFSGISAQKCCGNNRYWPVVKQVLGLTQAVAQKSGLGQVFNIVS
jgi:hypothetical protein